jgi:hypothetical protein
VRWLVIFAAVSSAVSLPVWYMLVGPEVGQIVADSGGAGAVTPADSARKQPYPDHWSGSRCACSKSATS